MDPMSKNGKKIQNERKETLVCVCYFNNGTVYDFTIFLRYTVT